MWGLPDRATPQSQGTSTAPRCWFHEKTAVVAFYVTVHGYFIIISLFSAVVLGLVAWKIFTLPTATAGKEQGPNWKGVLTVLSLSSLVGVTWWLAILTPLGRSTIYVFALFNSLQGEASGPGRCWLASPIRGCVGGMGRRQGARNRSHSGWLPSGLSPGTPGREGWLTSWELEPASGKAIQTKADTFRIVFSGAHVVISHLLSVETPSFSPRLLPTHAPKWLLPPDATLSREGGLVQSGPCS